VAITFASLSSRQTISYRKPLQRLNTVLTSLLNQTGENPGFDWAHRG
jgi:hypothetical protein